LARLFDYPHHEFFNSSQMKIIVTSDSIGESFATIRAERRRQDGSQEIAYADRSRA
jgi:hypothetical protein